MHDIIVMDKPNGCGVINGFYVIFLGIVRKVSSDKLD